MLIALLLVVSITLGQVFAPSPMREPGATRLTGVVTWVQETRFVMRAPSGRALVWATTSERGIRLGQQVTVEGRVREPEGTFALWIRGEGCNAWIFPTLITIDDPSQPWWAKAMTWVRDMIKGTFLLIPERYRISPALLLGDRTLVHPETRDTFDLGGASHLLAASGLHLAIILALMKWGLKIKNRKWLLIAALLYCIVTGFRVSMVRASIMLTLSLIKLPFLRNRFTRLFVALAIILIIWPYAIWSVSLWLSFTCTLGILLAVPLLRKYPKFAIVITTTAAQLAALPITAWYFGRIPFIPASIVANMIAIPVTSGILALSVMAVTIPPPFSIPLVYIAYGLSWVVVQWLAVIAPAVALWA